MTQKTILRAKKDIPNVEGYKFYGVLQDTTIIETEVKKLIKGCIIATTSKI